MNKVINYITDSCDTLRETLALYGLVLITATCSYTLFEGWSWFDAFYTSVVTSSSTGYGDFSPKTIGGKLTTIALIFSTIFFIIPLVVGHIVTICMKNSNEFTHEEQEEMKSLLKKLAEK